MASSFSGSTFNGTASATADFGVLGASGEVSLVDYPAQSYNIVCGPSTICGSDPVRASAAFTDDPVTISVLFAALVLANDSAANSGPYDLKGTANFGSTAMVSGLQVNSDPQLQFPIASFSVSAESGSAPMSRIQG